MIRAACAGWMPSQTISRITKTLMRPILLPHLRALARHEGSVHMQRPSVSGCRLRHPQPCNRSSDILDLLLARNASRVQNSPLPLSMAHLSRIQCTAASVIHISALILDRTTLRVHTGPALTAGRQAAWASAPGSHQSPAAACAAAAPSSAPFRTCPAGMPCRPACSGPQSPQSARPQKNSSLPHISP